MIKHTAWRNWLLRVWPGVAFAFLLYIITGGGFNAHAIRQMLSALLIGICFGLPLFWLFRVIIRWLAFRSRAKGHWATAVGILLTFGVIVMLVHLIPRSVGVICLALGLLGGIAGSLEAKDHSLKRDT